MVPVRYSSCILGFGMLISFLQFEDEKTIYISRPGTFWHLYFSADCNLLVGCLVDCLAWGLGDHFTAT